MLYSSQKFKVAWLGIIYIRLDKQSNKALNNSPIFSSDQVSTGLCGSVHLKFN